MSVKTRIKFLSGLVLLALVLFGIFTFSLFQQNRLAHDKATVASEIVLQVFEKKNLGDQYALHQTDRAWVQWFAKQAYLDALIAKHKPTFQSPREKEAIGRIEAGLSESRDVFLNIRTLYDTKPQAGTDFSSEKATQLTSQLVVKTQETISAASGLKKINDANATETFRQIIMLFSAVGTVVVLLLLFCLREIWRSAARLEKQRAQSEAILRDIGDAVFAINADGEIVLFNKMAAKLSGFAEEEALGRPFAEILKFADEKTGKPGHDFIQSALAGKKSRMLKGTVIHTSSGRHVPVADSAAPVLNVAGNVEGVVVVFRDTTPERKLEQAKDEFFSTASHQLRTPLGSLRWNIELLLDQPAKLPKDIAAHLQTMRASSSRALSLIDDMLSMVRIEQGRIQDNPVETDLKEVVNQAIEEMEPIARENKIRLSLQVVQKPPLVFIDAKHFREVVQNLLSNAVKYTPPKGRVAVTIDIKSGHTLISVIDSGIGIPKGDQRRIFSKFFRAHNVLDANTAGSGLGLFIARAYVERWGGRLWFKSGVNAGKSGTTFYLSIPHIPKDIPKGRLKHESETKKE
ncbi:MAG TPA: ATP-binding protein [Candidatus Limnocylindria bacterium]|nr:ATP-binding protein [Candidatus Limnocylindria bacterium]